MQALFSYFTLLLLTAGCQNTADDKGYTKLLAASVVVRDTIVPLLPPPPRPYSELEFEKKEVLAAASGTKSVLFNSKGSKLFAMNLEGMSVYEFDRASRKITREFKFKPTRGTGWDYNKSRPIASYQEKPVEACFSHDDRILWVSLHNADGIIPIWVDDFSKNNAKRSANQKTKPVTVIYPGSNKKDSFQVPLIETGKTPKVISRTADNKNLLVSNWHSRNVSVLEMNDTITPYGKVMKEDDMNVAASPRHLVMDTSGHLFVSYNSLGTIACLDAATGKSLFTAKTHAQPRTIVLSKNYKFIFVTCYSSDFVDVYKINADNFEKVASLPCSGHPVGVDIFENDTTLEAWVCSYSNGLINIYSFKKK